MPKKTPCSKCLRVVVLTLWTYCYCQLFALWFVTFGWQIFGDVFLNQICENAGAVRYCLGVLSPFCLGVLSPFYKSGVQNCISPSTSVSCIIAAALQTKLCFECTSPSTKVLLRTVPTLLCVQKCASLSAKVLLSIAPALLQKFCLEWPLLAQGPRTCKQAAAPAICISPCTAVCLIPKGR